MVVVSSGRDDGSGQGAGISRDTHKSCDAPVSDNSPEATAQVIKEQVGSLLDRVSQQAQTELDRFKKTISNPNVTLIDTVIATYRDQVLARNVFHDLRLADDMLKVAMESRDAVVAIPNARHVSKVARALSGVLDEFIRTFPAGVTRQNIVRGVEPAWRDAFAEGISVITDEMRLLGGRLRPFSDALDNYGTLGFFSAATDLGDMDSRLKEVMREAQQLDLTFRRDTVISRHGSQVDGNVEQEVVDRVRNLPEKFRDLVQFIEEVRPALLTAVYKYALEQRQSELLEEESSEHESSPSEATEAAPEAISTTESAVFRYVLNAGEGRHADAIDSLRSVGAVVTPATIKATIDTLVEEGLLGLEEAQNLKLKVRSDLVEARKPLAIEGRLSDGSPSPDPEEFEVICLGLEGLGFGRSQVEKLAPTLSLEGADHLDTAMRNPQLRGFADILPVVAEFALVTDPHILTKDIGGIAQRLARACELWRKAIKAGIDPSTTSGVPDLIHRLESHS